MKFLMGLILGLAVVFLLGAIEYYQVELSGEFARVGTYRCAFSGVSAAGDCYLAITNTTTGKTEVIGITEYIRSELKDRPHGRQASVILDITMK